MFHSKNKENMKYTKYLAIGAVVIGSVAITSCKDDYMDTVPSSSISENTINTSLNNLYLAINGIHREMVSQESIYQCLGGAPGINMCMDVEADDINWKTNTWMQAAYLGWTANMNNQSGYNSNVWRLYYQWILNANKILEGLEKVTNNDANLYNLVKGEALCFRAWAHFQLVQTYAKRYAAGGSNTQDGVPYRVSSAGGELARSSVEEVYSKINADLTEACTLLDGQKPGVTHYSDMVAWGLKARVALAMQDYTNAAQYAAKAITIAEANGYKLMTGTQLNCGFSNITTDTKEALYAAVTANDQTVYFYSFYAYMSWNFNSSAVRQGVKCINAETYNTMSTTDLRRAWWDPTGKAAVPATNYAKNIYQNRKFTARSTADAVGDVAFMRLAELYLTEAEALARTGKAADAQTVFTKFQVTRDPSYVSKGNTGDALVTEIMNSRRVELWGEGFRFFDLKRLNEPIKRGSNFIITFCSFTEKAAGTEGWVWEIPKAETDYNSLCTKNY